MNNNDNSETEYWNMSPGLAHELTVLTELYRSSHSGQFLTGPTERIAIGLAHKQRFSPNFIGLATCEQFLTELAMELGKRSISEI